jgi:hypothetical protein
LVSDTLISWISPYHKEIAANTKPYNRKMEPKERSENFPFGAKEKARIRAMNMPTVAATSDQMN